MSRPAPARECKSPLGPTAEAIYRKLATKEIPASTVMHHEAPLLTDGRLARRQLRFDGTCANRRAHILFEHLALAGDHGPELTTSASLLAFTEYSARGPTLTLVAVGVGTAALLAWKESFQILCIGLTDEELRSAGILGVVAGIVVLPSIVNQR